MRQKYLGLGLILLVTFLAYYPSLHNGFTNWDDDQYVTANLGIRDLSRAGLASLLTGFTAANWHPLTMLTYALEYRRFGLDPRGYHAVNLSLHLLNTLLVFWVVQFLGAGTAASLAAALLFGVHPLHVESVAWVAELKDVLSACFFLLALIAWLRYRSSGRPPVFYALALAGTLLSLLAKPMGVSLPLVFLLADWRQAGRLERRDWLEQVPFALLAAASAGLTLVAQKSGKALLEENYLAFSQNLAVAARGVFFYLGKFLLPIHLSAFYPYPFDGGADLPPAFILWVPAAAFLLTLFLLMARRSRTILFGGGFFLVVLLPVLQLVPVGSTMAADRYAYLPSLGLCYLAGVGCSRWTLCFRRPGWRRLPAAVLIAASLVLAALTWQRTRVWMDGVTLWSDVLATHPRSFRALNSRGDAYLAKGDLDRAVADYQRALKGKPDHPGNALAHARLGNLFLRQGRSREAVAAYTRAVELAPRLAMLQNDLGLALDADGRRSEAMDRFRRALELDPRFADAHLNLGIALAETGSPDQAIDHYRSALRINPDLWEAHFNLAADLEAQGRLSEAGDHYRAALRLAPGSREAAAGLNRVLGQRRGERPPDPSMPP